MGIKGRSPGGSQDETPAVVAEEAIAQQAKPAAEAVGDTTVTTTEEAVLTEEVTLSSDAREALPMPAAIPAAPRPVLSVIPVAVPADQSPAARADTPGVPVSEAARPRTEVNLGLSVLAFGGLVALFHADHRKERGKPEEDE